MLRSLDDNILAPACFLCPYLADSMHDHRHFVLRVLLGRGQPPFSLRYELAVGGQCHLYFNFF
jgi:hypothetical protein